MSAGSLDRAHCRKFAFLVVQDDGRMKPVDTVFREFLRETDTTVPAGLKKDQMALDLFINADAWQHVPMIPVRDPMIRNLLGLIHKKDRAAYLDFFDRKTGDYKLAERLVQAHRTSAGDRDRMDRDLLRIDERVRSLDHMLAGSRFRIFPKTNDPDQRWYSYYETMAQFPDSEKERTAI